MREYSGEAREEEKMSERLPLVSVIMPCYNHEAYVGSAIESVLNQTYPNIELIVADNGSTDNSFEVINRYRDRIKILRLEKNNRQLCIRMLGEATTGEYIAQTTSDDEWMPEKIQLQMNAFLENPDLRGCFTWALYADENLQVYPDQENNVFLVRNRSREDWMRRFIYGGNCLCYPSSLAKRSDLLHAIGAYRGYVQLADFYQWTLFLLKGDIYVVEQPMVKFRWHVSGDNRNDSAPSAENFIRMNQEYAEIVLCTVDAMDDDFFRRTFGAEFVDGSAATHEKILCEKFFLLKRMAEASFIFSEIMMNFYHDHYGEMEHVLKTEYGFSFEDSSELFAKNGLACACEMINSQRTLNVAQGEYINAYISIAEKLSEGAYCGGFDRDRARAVFGLLPEGERSRLKGLYALSSSVLKVLTQAGAAGGDVYRNAVGLAAKLCRLMGELRRQTRLLGILQDDEEFRLFEQLVSLSQVNEIDLQEAVVPYIQLTAERLGSVVDNV